MARLRYDILELIDRLEPGVRRSFLDAVADIKSEAQLKLLTAALADNDFARAWTILQMDPAFFSPLDEALRAAYYQGGVAALAALPALPPNPITGGPVVARFNVRNPRAEAWVRDWSSSLITEIVEDTRQGTMAYLTEAMQTGTGPREAALDLVGRVDRQTGKRVGGIIGLHSSQARWVANAKAELLSGDPTRMANYFTRKRRDKRFDGAVRKAIREGRPVPREQVNAMVARYSDRLLKLRGETIARTELLQGLHNAQDEGVRQLIEAGHIRPDQVIATWDASEDGATRPSHRAMEGQKRDRNGQFTTGDGFKMRYPGDRSLDAPASEIINCRCRVEISFDWSGLVGR
jgi:hypothetical protein